MANTIEWARASRGFVPFEAERFVALALQRAGRAAFSDCLFLDPLRRLLAAYDDEADLGLFGRMAVRFDVMRCLTNLLRLDEEEEKNPAIAARPIAEPLFITGLPRSSTTFLHTLLAQDPANAVPRCWQLIYPYPHRRRLLRADLRRSVVKLQFGIFRALSPGLDDLHPLAADAPQECTDITAQVFQSLRFDSTYRVPSYQSWLQRHGHLDAYRFHRRFLQHLDAQSPGRWVLKSPDHVFALDAIEAVYPDAHIVFLHRDPVSVVASQVRLTESLRKPFARRIDRAEIGRQNVASLIDGTDRMTRAAQRSGAILHLHYRDVVASPMEAVRSVYRHCGRDLGPDAARRMQAWLDRARRTPRIRQAYSLSEFDLDAPTLRKRFQRYMDVFGIVPEWSVSPL
ncbi:MAG: sulfotransferase [Alphaproteobacteria bacterium]|nr:sulfotransferase [Alphaproteobacteria bacterium]